MGASAKSCDVVSHGDTSAASSTDDDDDDDDDDDNDNDDDADAKVAMKPASTIAVTHDIAINRWLIVELSVILGSDCIIAAGACVLWHACITATATHAQDSRGAAVQASSRDVQCCSSLAAKSPSQ